MKKILAILALAMAGSAFAASVSFEYQNIDNAVGVGQDTLSVSVKHNFTKSVTGDVLFSDTKAGNNGALSNRIEVGLSATAPLGPVTGYTRVALGEKIGNSTMATYYSIEPGISAPVGPFTAKVGYRYRSAVDSANGDQTHTVRAGLSYPLTKVDAIGVRYDRVRGDNTQNIVALNYTRTF